MEILKTKKQIADKLLSIAEDVRKEQIKGGCQTGRFCIPNSLLSLLPQSMIRKSRGVLSAATQESPLFAGAETVVLSQIQYVANFTETAPDKYRGLYFEIECEFRSFKADGLYLIYARGYKEKTASLRSLEYEDLVKRFGGYVKGLSVPNKIGTLTAKKLDEWIDYNKRLVQGCKDYEKEKEMKCAEFRKKLRTVCPDKYKKDEGSVTLNGVRFSWTICDSGRVYTKNTVINDYDSGIDNFFKLAHVGC